MTYEATLKVKFDTKFVNQSGYGIYDDEVLPEEHYTFQIPAQDLNTIQLFRFFGTVARTMGHNDIGIMKGACSLAFNDMRSEEDMRKIADEYDLILSEDFAKEVNKLNAEIWDLKAKISRLENPENPQYTDEEMDAMTYQEWGHLIPGSDEYDLVLSEDFAKEVNKLNAEIWDLKAKISRLENPENPQYTDEEMDAMTFQEWGNLIPGSDEAVAQGCKCPILDNQEMPEERKWVNGDCPLHGKGK